MLIALSMSASDQPEKVSFAASIEQVHNLTVILPQRMHGIKPSKEANPVR